MVAEPLVEPCYQRVAEGFLAEAADLARDGADAVLEGRVQLSIAAMSQAQGQTAGQGAALERAAAMFAGCGTAYLEVRALAELAMLRRERGDMVAARTAWNRVESLYQAGGVPVRDQLYSRKEH